MSDDPWKAPLDDFIAARDALAARLKAAGDKDGAAGAKRARKPSVPAWAANQVVWRASGAWERLREATVALREAHETGAPDAVRRASRDQRDALQACIARAGQLLSQHGHAPTPAVLQKVEHTLLALAHGAPGLTPGRLDRELAPPGFEALAGLTLTPPAAPRSTVEGEGSSGSQEKEALSAAEARLEDARHARDEARLRLDREEGRRRALEAELEAARRACDDARRRLEEAEAAHAAAEAALEASRPRDPGDPTAA
ncbi:MAG TPA: hypothetical protein VLL75_02335 [Vicinamibacteria bacterium]|nr:hypothetical protein [Vicinamibacteria bacterium]